MKVITFLILAGIIALAAGCSLVTVSDDGSTVRHHFGYVRIITPPTVSDSGRFEVSEYSTFGVKIERGFGLGYFHERQEYIPLDCRLVVRVANEAQLQEALHQLKDIEGGKICATVYRE